MSKHTPGPWLRGDSDLPVSAISIHGGTRDHTTLARLVSPTFVGMPFTEMEANARLIAAAPEMYELLSAIQRNEPAAITRIPELLARIKGAA